MPAMIAVGVASPSAHGQAITSTVTSAMRPWVKACSPPIVHHAMALRSAITITTGTKIPATLSTSFCTGALLPCASCTALMICASNVAPPTFFARMRRLPFWLIVPASNDAPIDLITGTGSPLIMLSST